MATAPAKFKHTKSDCPICTWHNRSYMLPNHIITHHTTDVKLRKVQTDHCIYAYVMKGAVEHGFCVCLTCKKGVATEGHTRQGSRWATNHMKQKACKAAHKEALKEFKTKLVGDIPISVSVVETPVKPQCDEDPVEILWNKCKERPRIKPFLEDIERQYKEEYEDNSDIEEPYVFAHSEGFRYCIEHAIGFKKRIAQLEQTMEQMRKEFDAELKANKETISGLQQEVYKQKQALTSLEEENAKQREMITDLQKRIQQLEANQQ